MTSKEAFEKIIDLCNYYQHTIVKDTEVATIWGYPIDNIRKDLEILEKYKSIEDVLGIDLITLFKALKDGINVYYEDIGRYKFRNNLRLEYHKTLGWGLVYIYGCSCRDDMPMKLDKEFYELKDYQKTWFLKEDICEEESKDE